MLMDCRNIHGIVSLPKFQETEEAPTIPKFQEMEEVPTIITEI